MSDKLTPEEKLLKLIKKKKIRSRLFFILSENTKNTWSKLKNLKVSCLLKVKRVFSGKTTSIKVRGIPILYINRFLIICTGILSLYFIKTIFFLTEHRPITRDSFKQSIPPVEEELTASAAKSRKLSFYLRKTGGKNVFRIIEPARPKVTKSIPKEGPGPRERANDLILSGIVSDGERLQAVITDKKKHYTYFVYKGDFVGEFKIEDIFESKIIVSFGEEQLEIHLH